MSFRAITYLKHIGLSFISIIIFLSASLLVGSRWKVYKYLLKIIYIVYKIVWRKALWHDKIVGAFPDKHLEAVKMRSTYVLYKQFVGRATKLSQNVFQV